ncbi:MAG: hypothetical protein ACXAEI_20275, partial [Candidatus Hodarchaeales archaeon]
IPRQTLSLLVDQNLISMDALRRLPRYGSFFLTREDLFFEFLSNFSYYGYEGMEGFLEFLNQKGYLDTHPGVDSSILCPDVNC